jgi:hypothetical protein
LINVLVISDGFTVETDIIARKLPKI